MRVKSIVACIFFVLFVLSNKASATVEVIQFDDDSLLMRFTFEDIEDLINYFAFFLVKRAVAVESRKSRLKQSFAILFVMFVNYLTMFFSVAVIYTDNNVDFWVSWFFGLMVLWLFFQLFITAGAFIHWIISRVRGEQIASLSEKRKGPDYFRDKLIEQKLLIDHRIAQEELESDDGHSDVIKEIKRTRFLLLYRPFSTKELGDPQPDLWTDRDGSEFGFVNKIRIIIDQFEKEHIEDKDHFIFVRCGDDMKRVKVAHVMMDVLDESHPSLPTQTSHKPSSLQGPPVVTKPGETTTTSSSVATTTTTTEPSSSDDVNSTSS